MNWETIQALENYFYIKVNRIKRLTTLYFWMSVLHIFVYRQPLYSYSFYNALRLDEHVTQSKFYNTLLLDEHITIYFWMNMTC